MDQYRALNLASNATEILAQRKTLGFASRPKYEVTESFQRIYGEVQEVLSDHEDVATALEELQTTPDDENRRREARNSLAEIIMEDSMLARKVAALIEEATTPDAASTDVVDARGSIISPAGAGAVIGGTINAYTSPDLPPGGGAGSDPGERTED
jgi:hypothetical protein